MRGTDTQDPQHRNQSRNKKKATHPVREEQWKSESYTRKGEREVGTGRHALVKYRRPKEGRRMGGIEVGEQK